MTLVSVGGWVLVRRALALNRDPDEMIDILGTFDKWAEDFRVIGHSLRLSILFMIYASELYQQQCLTVSQIRDVLSFPKTKNSFNKIEHHLSVLLENGFVERVSHQKEKGRSRIRVLYRTSGKTKQFLTDFKLDEKIRTALQIPV